MKFNLLISAIIAPFVLISISCSNKTGEGSTSTTDSTKVETSEQATTPSVKKYDLKSAIVTYATKTMGMKNSQILYFDDYGAKERQETVTELEVMKTKIRTVNVSITKDGYKYDFVSENTTNGENKANKEIRKSKATVTVDMASMASVMSEADKKEYDYKEEGTETVAGKTGTKFSMKTGKTRFIGVIYKKVMLKTEMDIMTIIAEKFEENASIPAEIFELPKDYKIIETK